MLTGLRLRHFQVRCAAGVDAIVKAAVASAMVQDGEFQVCVLNWLAPGNLPPSPFTG